MVDVDKAVIAKLKIGGEHFEVLCESTESAVAFRQGKALLEDVLVVEAVFKDARKGMRASEHEMQRLFMTSDVRQIASHIIKKGDLQISAEYQNKIREEKKKQVINLIHKNAVDPKTNIPHPPQRIENALVIAKVNIDHNKTAEEQIHDILKKLQPVIPIKYETREIELHIPSSFAGQSFSSLKKNSKILSSRYENDGSLTCVVEVPAGMQSELFDTLNKITHGQVQSKILRTK